MCFSLVNVASCAVRGLCDGPIPHPGSPTECAHACVCVSLNMVKGKYHSYICNELVEETRLINEKNSLSPMRHRTSTLT